MRGVIPDSNLLVLQREEKKMNNKFSLFIHNNGEI